MDTIGDTVLTSVFSPPLPDVYSRWCLFPRNRRRRLKLVDHMTLFTDDVLAFFEQPQEPKTPDGKLHFSRRGHRDRH